MPALTASRSRRCARSATTLRDQLLRKRAEFENYRKRVERDREQSATDATASVLKAVIPTIDNLDRALEATGAESTLRQGVELTRRELLALLERQGVTIEDPQGQPFDPQRHQALSHEAAPRQVPTERWWRCSARAMPSRRPPPPSRPGQGGQGREWRGRRRAGARYTDGSLSEAMIG